MELSLNLYQSMAVAVAVFYIGAFLKSKVQVFRTYCIPSPVIGGILYAIINLILYSTGILVLTIDVSLKDVFMNIFFTSVGFTAGFGMLKKGGKSLVIFLIAVALLICVQDVVGALLCSVFGLDPLLGLALGSMPLTGGHGTSTAFAPILVEEYGISNALTVAVAAATYGLVAGNIIGNPLARRRIRKLGLSSADASSVNQEALLELKKNTEGGARLDVGRGTLALALLFVATGIGTLFSMLFELTKPGVLENVIIKAQHNCMSDQRVYSGKFIPIVHEYVLLVRKDAPLAVPLLMTYRVQSDIRDMPGPTWRDIVASVLETCRGSASLEEIYRQVEPHKRAQSQQWWKEKVRQTLQINPETFEHMGRGVWRLI